MKRALFVAALVVAAAMLAATPAAAQTSVKDRSCSMQVGSNTVTYACGFHVKDYTVGTPVTIYIDYACTGACGPVLSFGLRDRGFAPAGTTGRLVGGARTPDGLQLTFVFDSLKGMGKSATGSAYFKMNLNMDDGSGNMTPVPCNVDVHLNSE